MTNSPLRRRKDVSYQSCSQPQVCPLVTISTNIHPETTGYPFGEKINLDDKIKIFRIGKGFLGYKIMNYMKTD